MKINLSTWPRREHFEFYKSFDEPYWGCTVDCDISHLRSYCKHQGVSLFSAYHYAAIKAANEIENFRYRIQADNEVFLYPFIHISSVFLRQDKTFGFGFVPFENSFSQHDRALAAKQIEAEECQGIFIDQDSGRDDVMHFSALPWIGFSSMSHARALSRQDSCPKISFGKICQEGDKILMPMSIHVHHGLVDGYHMGQFVEVFQQILDEFPNA